MFQVSSFKEARQTSETLNLKLETRMISFLLIFLFMISAPLLAEPPLLSLEVQDSRLKWQNEFVLTLSIYTPAEVELPPVTVDGLDQFKLQGTGKNLLQIPRGKTKRYILTYTLVASEPGSFKIGPAILALNGQTYRSNILFLTVEGGPAGKSTGIQPPPKSVPVPTIAEPPQPQPETKEEKKEAAPPPKQTATPPKKEEKKTSAPPPKQESKTAQAPLKEEKKPAAATTPPPSQPKPAPQQPQPKPTTQQTPASQQKQVSQQQTPPSPPKQTTQKQIPAVQAKPVSPQPKPQPPVKQENKPTPAPPQPAVPKPEPKKEVPQAEPTPTPKPTVQPPVVLSSAQIGDRIVILMDTPKPRPYRYQGIPVTVRLLSQLPVENLQFLEEADFPGFLRYDFPFTSKPKGEVVSFRNDYYASFELVKFLLFPLQAGKIDIPAVRCELKVRVPSGAFPEADLRTTIQRSSNELELQVKPTPNGAIVGDFALRNEIISDEKDSKVVRIALEGNGQLSTFEFPEIPGTNFVIRKFNASTNVKMEGDHLISKKVQDLEILPQPGVVNVVIPPLLVAEFDPDSAQLERLKLPELNLRFTPAGTPQKAKPLLPQIGSKLGGTVLLILLMVTAAALYMRNVRPPKTQKHLKLKRLFSSKNLKLSISRSAARKLYQEIASQIAAKDGDSTTLMETVRKHVPQEEWLNIDRGLRKLERTAYSSTTPATITYEEMKKICEKLETLWVPPEKSTS